MTDISGIVAMAKLDGIDVVRCHWDREHPSVRGPLRYPPHLKQHLDIGVRHPDPMDAGGAAYLVTMQLRWEEDAGAIAAWAEVQLRVVYSFTDATLALTPEQVQAFGHNVALHQAWPFLRHRLQLLAMELGLNPALLPLKPLTDVGARPSGDAPPR